MALTDNAGKKYTNEHPKFSIEANKAEAENVTTENIILLAKKYRN